MRNLAFIEQNTTYQLAAVTYNASISDYHISSYVATFTKFTVSSDNGWAFYHSPMLYDGALSD